MSDERRDLSEEKQEIQPSPFSTLKTLVISVLGFLLSASICLAADEYVLVMSKDNDVCLHMGMLFNRDLKKYGAIRFDKHEEFNAIKWERKRAYNINEKGERDYGERTLSQETMLLSMFDINNDGTKEIVLNRDLSRSGRHIPSNNIFAFKQQDSKYFDEFKYGVNRNHDLLGMAMIIEGGRGRFLNELPPAEIAPELGYEKNVVIRNALIGSLLLHPVFYKGSYFVTMTDWQPDEVAEWLVIVKYTPDNQAKDVCYYLKAVDCNSKKSKGGRK